MKLCILSKFYSHMQLTNQTELNHQLFTKFSHGLKQYQKLSFPCAVHSAIIQFHSPCQIYGNRWSTYSSWQKCKLSRHLSSLPQTSRSHIHDLLAARFYEVAYINTEFVIDHGQKHMWQFYHWLIPNLIHTSFWFLKWWINIS